MTPYQYQSLTAALKKAIEFHRTNQDDPHGISIPVMTALLEVLAAFENSIGQQFDPISNPTDSNKSGPTSRPDSLPVSERTRTG